jgi:hypothetical protein
VLYLIGGEQVTIVITSSRTAPARTAHDEGRNPACQG